MTIIGDALKAHRTKHGLTQAQLASRIGCTQGLLAHWEQGKGRPSKYATAIGREFGWTMAQLDDAMRDAPTEDDANVLDGITVEKGQVA